MATIQVSPRDVIAKDLIAYKCIDSDCGFYFTQRVEIGTFFCPRCKYTTKPIFNYYSLFGLTKDYSLSDLKNSYKLLSQKYHPDKTKDDKEEVEELFMIIRKGYDILNDETERELYDHELYMFDQFLAGKTVEEKVVTKSLVSGAVITFILGLILAGLLYYQTKDAYLPIFGLMVWVTVLFLWKESFVNTVRLLCEVGFIGVVGYVFFKEEWTVGLLLTIAMFGYMILKYLMPAKKNA